MLVERTKKEIIIRIPSTVNTDDLQDLINYARYKELSSTFSVSQAVVDKLADEINRTWWKKNKAKLVK